MDKIPGFFKIIVQGKKEIITQRLGIALIQTVESFLPPTVANCLVDDHQLFIAKRMHGPT